jgi:DNA-binding HxlR family transcriptional regulator
VRIPSHDSQRSISRLNPIGAFASIGLTYHLFLGLSPEYPRGRSTPPRRSLAFSKLHLVHLFDVPGKPKLEHRSGCPVSISLEMLGDRWSLLIVRDLMVRGLRTFKEFQGSSEGIATNILADRLQKLDAAGIIMAEAEEKDGRRVNYRLTEKGIDLAPVLLELLIWGARHEETGAPCALIDDMEKNREGVLAEARRRWRERDLTPLLPPFKGKKERKR